MKKRNIETEIVVVGGGPGGLFAAVSAAREGAKVTLVEREGFVGGNLNLGLPLLAFLDAQGREVTKGLAQEFVDRLIEMDGAFGHRECPLHNSTTVINPVYARLICFEWIKKYGINLMLHSDIIDTNVEDGEIKSITVECKGDRTEIFASVFIDGTGDGTMAYLAGAEYEKGQKETKELQPPTLMFNLGNVNLDKFFEWLDEHPEQLEHGESMQIRDGYTSKFLKSSENHVFVGLKKLISDLRAKGLCPIQRDTLIYINLPMKNEVAINTIRVLDFDGSDPDSLTQGEIDAHSQVLPLLKMLKDHVPGFEEAYITSLSPFIGIRETRRIVGKKMVVETDAVEGRVDEDTIALGSYIIDIHSGSGEETIIKSLKNPYGIPYKATISKSIDNLMMSGRCISVDAVVFGSSRVMPTLMAAAEGTGIGAALAVKSNKKPEEIDVKEIREKLIDYGAILSI